MKDKNSDSAQFNRASLFYALQIASSDEAGMLTQFGVSPERAAKLKNLKGADVHEIAASISTPVVSLQFDLDALDQAFDLVERRNRDKERETRLIMAGASYEIMRRLFGMDPRLFASYRKEFGLVDEGVGRPKYLGQDTIEAIWSVWHGTGGMPHLADRLLKVHEIVGSVSVRHIWQIVSLSVPEESTVIDAVSQQAVEDMRALDESFLWLVNGGGAVEVDGETEIADE